MIDARDEFVEACEFFFDNISPSDNRLRTAATRMSGVDQTIKSFTTDDSFIPWLSQRINTNLSPDVTFADAAKAILEHLKARAKVTA